MRFVSSTYDQENRLIRVTTANGNRSEFSYEGMSRRVETIEYQANSLASTTRYLYDGLLPIAELDASNAVTRTITRGTDLSGSMQGAGGIGGILATNGNEYSYDGNGNVRDIISASGLNVAHYEYDPFGNKTVSSGSYSSQPYQWSSKEFHAPSGLVYYLYRFYSPQLGRWINRDPIEEAGGINLYGFVGNDGVNNYDVLGLFDLPNTTATQLLNKFSQTFPRSYLPIIIAIVQEALGGDPWAPGFLWHYLFDKGETITLKVGQVKDLKPSSVYEQINFHDEGGNDFFQKPRQIIETNYPKTLNIFTAGAGNATLGEFNIKYKGEVKPSCEFIGEFKVEGNYNFNWRDFGERSPVGEILLRAFTLTYSGIPFDVDSEWVPIKQKMLETAKW